MNLLLGRLFVLPTEGTTLKSDKTLWRVAATHIEFCTKVGGGKLRTPTPTSVPLFDGKIQTEANTCGFPGAEQLQPSTFIERRAGQPRVA